MRRMLPFILGGLLPAFLLTGCSRKTLIPAGTIVFLGDSITAGYGLDSGQAYPALIEIPGMTMLNLGISGSTTADGLQRLKDYFSNGGKPSLAIIALGANDILHGVSPDETRANLNSAIAECKARGVPVLLCGIKIPFKFENDAIFEEVAHANHVALVPDLLMGEAFQENLLQEDRMHPTAEGQKLIADRMHAALLESFSFHSP
jgi:acyl-CoA thioesterase-1